MGELKVYSAMAACQFAKGVDRKKAWSLLTSAFRAVKDAHCFMSTDQMIRIGKKPKSHVRVGDVYNVGGGGAHIEVTDWNIQKGFAYNHFSIKTDNPNIVPANPARMEFKLRKRAGNMKVDIVRHERYEPLPLSGLTGIFSHMVMTHLARAIKPLYPAYTISNPGEVITIKDSPIFKEAVIKEIEDPEPTADF